MPYIQWLPAYVLHHQIISILLVQKIKAVIKEEREHPDHRDADAFIFAIFSHGAEGYILGTDAGKVKISDIEEAFDGKHCPALAGKPKVFLIQACQGSEYVCAIGELQYEVQYNVVIQNSTRLLNSTTPLI